MNVKNVNTFDLQFADQLFIENPFLSAPSGWCLYDDTMDGGDYCDIYQHEETGRR